MKESRPKKEMATRPCLTTEGRGSSVAGLTTESAASAAMLVE